MFILGQFVDTRLVLWALVITCLLFLILAIVFLVLYLRSNGESQQIVNSSTVTGQIVPSKYANVQALTPIKVSVQSGSWRRILCVGDDAFGRNITPDTLNIQNASTPYLLASLLQSSNITSVSQNVFGYDAALKDTRVTMTGNWLSGASQFGIGGRFFSTVNPADTLSFRCAQTQNYTTMVVYCLSTSAAFTLYQATNTTQTVTPSSLTPIVGTTICRVTYLTSIAPSEAFAKLNITATGATSSRPVQIVGIGLESGDPYVTNVCVSNTTSPVLFTPNGPTSLCGAGLTMLNPDVVLFYPPFADYQSGTVSQAQMVAAVKSFLDACAARNIPVLTATPHYGPPAIVNEATQSVYVSALLDLYKTYSNVALYDFRSDVGSFSNQQRLRLSYSTNTTGYNLSYLGGMRLAQGLFNAFFQ